MTEVRIQAGKVAQIPVGKLKPDPNNPRHSVDDVALQGLAQNIKARGVLQPLTIRKAGKGLMIVHGERRWRAAKLARLKTVPCLLHEDDGDVVGRGIDQVAENTARASLAPMDLARWLSRLQTTEKLSPNEIAARLDKAGLKAMTRAQVDDLIALVKLPAWAQEMVDLGQVEASVARQLLMLEHLPAEAGKEAGRDLEQKIKWAGRATSRDVSGAIGSGIRKVAAADLTITAEYYSDAVRFDWKKRCKLWDGKSPCPHLVQHAGGAWCLDKKLFAEHQAEAKKAGLGPGGKRAAKSKSGGGKDADPAEEAQAEKAEQRERSLGEKARDYLHAYLVRELAVAVEETAELQQALVLWAALKKPGSRGTRGPVLPPKLEPPEHDIQSLEGLTSDTRWYADARRAAALQHLFNLPWRETHALARQLWGNDVHVVWSLERPFLDLFRKAELVHVATVHQCELPEGRRSWEAMKGGELKDALLAQHEKLLRPAILADLYQGEIEAPYKSWSPDDDDEDDQGDDGSCEDNELEDAA